MSDSSLELLRRVSAGRASGPREEAQEEEELCCAAFGFLRGLRERAITLEFRFADGNKLALPYSWLGPVSYNPSTGLLLKFVGDRITLILIEGTYLEARVSGTGLHEGILRNRVVWVREMSTQEVCDAKQAETTVECIHVCSHRYDEEPLESEWLRPFRIGS